MTRSRKLKRAKTHQSQPIRDAECEPQVSSRHGKVVSFVTPVTLAMDNAVSSTVPRSALEALRGHFDFSDFPDEEQFERRSDAMRDLEL